MESRRVHLPCALPFKWDIGWEVDDGESFGREEIFLPIILILWIKVQTARGISC